MLRARRASLVMAVTLALFVATLFLPWEEGTTTRCGREYVWSSSASCQTGHFVHDGFDAQAGQFRLFLVLLTGALMVPRRAWPAIVTSSLLWLSTLSAFGLHGDHGAAGSFFIFGSSEFSSTWIARWGVLAGSLAATGVLVCAIVRGTPRARAFVGRLWATYLS